MFFSVDTHRDNYSLTRNTTDRIDMPKSGVLSSLYLRFTATAVSGAYAGTDAWRISDYIDQIRLVGNGSHVIADGKPDEFNFYTFQDQGAPVLDMWRTYATNTMFGYVLINFGRYIEDPEYGLDMSRWDTLVLEIKNSFTSTYISDSLTVDIIMVRAKGEHRFVPAGYLKKTVQREFTTVQDETKYYQLVPDPAIRTVAAWIEPDIDSTTYVDETSPFNTVYDINLYLQGKAFTLFEGYTSILAELDWYKNIGFRLNRGQIYGDADVGKRVGFCRPIGWATAGTTKDGAVASVIPTIIADATESRLKPEAYTADEVISFLTTGLAYAQVVPIFRSKALGEGSLLLPAHMPIELELHSRNSSTAPDGTVRVLLEQLVTG